MVNWRSRKDSGMDEPGREGREVGDEETSQYTVYRSGKNGGVFVFFSSIVYYSILSRVPCAIH